MKVMYVAGKPASAEDRLLAGASVQNAFEASRTIEDRQLVIGKRPIAGSETGGVL